MDGQQDPNIDHLMIRMREKIRHRREKAVLSPSSTDGIARDLATLDSSSDAFSIRFTSHRKIFTPLAMLVKHLLRRLLTPILMQQGVYNQANARVGRHLLAHIDVLNQEQSENRQMMDRNLQTLQDGQEHLREELRLLHTQAMQTLGLQTQANQSMREHFEAQLESLRQTQALHTQASQAMREHFEAQFALQAQAGQSIREQFEAQLGSQEELKQSLHALLAKLQDLEQQAS